MAYQPGHHHHHQHVGQQPPEVVVPAGAVNPSAPVAPMDGPVGTVIAPSATPDTHKIAKDVNEEYHDPLDDWSSRDTLLSLVPYIIVFALKDYGLGAGLTIGIAWSGFLLIMRIVAYDSRRKQIWSILDLTALIACAILRGLYRDFAYELTKWMPVILPLIFVSVALISLIIRRPFVGHYARYPKFDRGGHAIWANDKRFHRTCDLATLGWICCWSISLLLSLIPILTGRWGRWGALNIIFDYVVPFALVAAGLIYQQMMGTWYRSQASQRPHAIQTGAAYPAGPHGQTAPPVTYHSPVNAV